MSRDGSKSVHAFAIVRLCEREVLLRMRCLVLCLGLLFARVGEQRMRYQINVGGATSQSRMDDAENGTFYKFSPGTVCPSDSKIREFRKVSRIIRIIREFN